MTDGLYDAPPGPHVSLATMVVVQIPQGPPCLSQPGYRRL